MIVATKLGPFFSFVVEVLYKFKRTVSLISNDPPFKDENALLKPLSDQ